MSEFQLISTAWQTVTGISQDTEIRLFYYKYPLLEKPTIFRGVSVASVADIACMKLEAVGGRGLKRDFYDLYTICRLDDWSLEKVVALNRDKYGRKESDLPHLLKSLVYFDEAELTPERAEVTGGGAGNKLLFGVAFEVGDEGAEAVQLVGVFGKSEKELVDIIVQIFGETDIDDLEVFDVVGAGAGDKVAKAGQGLKVTFLVGAGVDNLIQPNDI